MSMGGWGGFHARVKEAEHAAMAHVRNARNRAAQDRRDYQVSQIGRKRDSLDWIIDTAAAVLGLPFKLFKRGAGAPQESHARAKGHTEPKYPMSRSDSKPPESHSDLKPM